MSKPLTLYIADENGNNAVYFAGTAVSPVFVLRQYSPGDPSLEEREVFEDSMDGGELAEASYRNPTAAISAFLPQTNQGDFVQAQLMRLVEQARDYQRRKIGPRIFLYEIRRSGGELWRSEIISARIATGNDPAGVVEQIGLGEVYKLVNLNMRRRYFWEGEETVVPLSNRNGSNVTSFLSVVSHDDSSNDNWVSIDANAIGGDLPTPPIIKITNTLDSTNRTTEIFVAHNFRSDPGDLEHILQGQTASGGTTTASGSASGGEYKAFSWSTETEFWAATWDLGTPLLNACRGNFFRLLFWFFNTFSYTNLEARFTINLGVSAVYESKWVTLRPSRKAQEAVSLQLPPYLVGAGDLYPLTLKMYLRRQSSGTHTVHLDFIQLSPLDGWRHLVPNGFGLAYTTTLTDDMVSDLLYTDGWSPAGKTGHYVQQGPAIFLRPSYAQRLYFIMRGSTGDGITRSAAIRVLYRQRRIAI